MGTKPREKSISKNIGGPDEINAVADAMKDEINKEKKAVVEESIVVPVDGVGVPSAVSDTEEVEEPKIDNKMHHMESASLDEPPLIELPPLDDETIGRLREMCGGIPGDRPSPDRPPQRWEPIRLLAEEIPSQEFLDALNERDSKFEVEGVMMPGGVISYEQIQEVLSRGIPLSPTVLKIKDSVTGDTYALKMCEWEAGGPVEEYESYEFSRVIDYGDVPRTELIPLKEFVDRLDTAGSQENHKTIALLGGRLTSHVSLQKLVTGTHYDEWEGDMIDEGRIEEMAKTMDDFDKSLVLDLFTMNPDRHGFNIIVEGKTDRQGNAKFRFWDIDNAFSFENSYRYYEGGESLEQSESFWADHRRAAFNNISNKAKDAFLEPERYPEMAKLIGSIVKKEPSDVVKRVSRHLIGSVEFREGYKRFIMDTLTRLKNNEYCQILAREQND